MFLMRLQWEKGILTKLMYIQDDKAMLHERNETSAREDSHLEEDPPPAYGDIYR